MLMYGVQTTISIICIIILKLEMLVIIQLFLNINKIRIIIDFHIVDLINANIKFKPEIEEKYIPKTSRYVLHSV